MPNHTRHNHTYSDSHIHILVAHNLEHMCNALLFLCPLGLTFTCWGCYGLCPTYSNRACPLSFIPFLCISVFMALSTVFHSINSPDSSPFSHSVLCGWLGSKHKLTNCFFVAAFVDSLGGADEELEQSRASGEDATSEEEFVLELDSSLDEEDYLPLARQIRPRKQPVATRRSSAASLGDRLQLLLLLSTKSSSRGRQVARTLPARKSWYLSRTVHEMRKITSPWQGRSVVGNSTLQ